MREDSLLGFMEHSPLSVGVMELLEDDVRWLALSRVGAAMLDFPLEEIIGRTSREIRSEGRRVGKAVRSRWTRVT